MEAVKVSTDTLFILLGAIMVLAMHSGFAFLEVGTVRRKNQVNALVKILADFAVSTIVYFFIGYGVAYGVSFMVGAEQLAEKSGFEVTKFFFLLTFAAAVPAIISGGIAERAKFNPQLIATMVIVGFIYPFFEGIAWNDRYGIQPWIEATTGNKFHDFAGSVVVITHDRWFLDRLATHIIAFEGDGYVHVCEGNFEVYERSRRERLGIAADEPHRFRYRKLTH
jgi:Amt family ammonium transporter